jgi:hypothetical protein
MNVVVYFFLLTVLRFWRERAMDAPGRDGSKNVSGVRVRILQVLGEIGTPPSPRAATRRGSGLWII